MAKRWRRLRRRLRAVRAWLWDSPLSSTPAAVIFGVLLVLVPTVYSIFPGLTGRGPRERMAVTAGWGVVALLVVLGATRQSQLLADLMRVPRRRRDLARRVAGQRLIELALQHHGFPEQYRFRLYLLDQDQGVLMPVYDQDDVKKAQGWAIGRGATGRAWQTESYQTLRGSQVIDGLKPEEQERYEKLKVVASVPVTNARRDVIGVLTGYGICDDGVLVSESGYDAHEVLAQVVARILIDVLRVADD
jgi:hypothetical protein